MVEEPAESRESCPALEVLERVAAADGTADEEAAVRRHLTACGACRERFERLLGSTEQYFAAPGAGLGVSEKDLDEIRARCLPIGVHAEGRGDHVEFPDGLRLAPPRTRPYIARLGPFDVVSIRGKGGMGIVLKAFDPSLQRDVALKVMRPALAQDEVACGRFLREARTAAGLDHPNIVAIHSVSQDHDPPFLVMQYVHGKSLSSILAASGALEPARAAGVARQILLALDHAHRQGVIHRDIKPANVLLESSDGTVKLVDFGLARALSDAARFTAEGVALGTPSYMSPEQAAGDASPDARSDLFSTGVALFEMLTGVVPFAGKDAHQVLFRICTETAPDPRSLDPAIPAELAAVVNRALSRAPGDRYGSAAEFLAALDAWLAASPAAPPVRAAAETPSPPEPRAPQPRQVPPEPARGRAMQVVLEVVEGTQAGKRFAFDRHNTFMVGRGQRAHFRIPDDRYFSRHHFMIEVSPPRCFLRDLGSTNGTYVNHRKVRQAHLRDGDVIHGGRTQIRVRIEHPEPPASPAPAEKGAPPAPPRARPRPKPRVSMDTLPIDGAEVPDRPGGLRCIVCGKPAADALIDELADTQIIAYACPECHQKHRTQQQPVPNYQVLGVAGRGSLGPVYKARRISSGKLVALKIIPEPMTSDPQAVRLFLRQMRLGAALRHPNIAPIVEMGQAGSELWVATELVDGTDAACLAQRLGGRLPVADAAGIVAQTLDALDYAHRLNLVHRDVKPTNVMVSGQPGAYRARLADFGLIRNLDDAGLSGITREGQCRGTVPFMPPEQVLESRFARPPGDLYAAGATLYWLLTGQYVHDFEAPGARGQPKDPFLVILEDPIVPIQQRDPSVPEPVAQVIHTSLSREPDDRPKTAAHMAASLRAAIGTGR